MNFKRKKRKRKRKREINIVSALISSLDHLNLLALVFEKIGLILNLIKEFFFASNTWANAKYITRLYRLHNHCVTLVDRDFKFVLTEERLGKIFNLVLIILLSHTVRYISFFLSRLDLLEEICQF